MANGPSAAERRAAVAKQLRDKKGRWIEMGAKVRFLVNGMERVGEVVGVNGNDASVAYRGNNGKPMVAKINGKGLEIVNAKASLPDPSRAVTPKAKTPDLPEANAPKRTRVEKLTAEDLEALPHGTIVDESSTGKAWKNYDGLWGAEGKGNPVKVPSETLAKDHKDLHFDPEDSNNKKIVDTDPELQSWLDSKSGKDSDNESALDGDEDKSKKDGPGGSASRRRDRDDNDSDAPDAGAPDAGAPGADDGDDSQQESAKDDAPESAKKKAEDNRRPHHRDRDVSPDSALDGLGFSGPEIDTLHGAKDRADARDAWTASETGQKLDDKFIQAMNKKQQTAEDKKFIKDYQDGKARLEEIHPDERENLLKERLAEQMRATNIASTDEQRDASKKRVSEIDERLAELDKAPESSSSDEAAGDSDLDKQIADLQDEEDFLKNSGATPAEVRAVKKQKDKLVEERDGVKKDSPAVAPVAPEATPEASDGDSIEIDEIDSLPDGSVVRLDGTINGDEDITEFHKDSGSWIGSNENEEVDLDADALKDYINSRDPQDIVHVNSDSDSAGAVDGVDAVDAEEFPAPGELLDEIENDEDLGKSIREDIARRENESAGDVADAPEESVAPVPGQPEIGAPKAGTAKTANAEKIHTGTRVEGEDDLDLMQPGQTVADLDHSDERWIKLNDGNFVNEITDERMASDELAEKTNSGSWGVVDPIPVEDMDVDWDEIAKLIEANDEDWDDILGVEPLDEKALAELPEGATLEDANGKTFTKDYDGRWLDNETGEYFSSARLSKEHKNLKETGVDAPEADAPETDGAPAVDAPAVDEVDAEVPSVTPVSAVPDGTVGFDESGRPYVNTADGAAVFEGDRVRSTKDGLEGEIVKIESNGKYVKVRGDDGKIRGRRINTIESSDTSATPLEPVSAPSDAPEVDAPSVTPEADAPASGLKVADDGRSYVDSASGDQIFEGSTVLSKTDGLAGTVVKLEANGKYVKVRGEDGKIRGRKADTLDVTINVSSGTNEPEAPNADAPEVDEPEANAPDVDAPDEIVIEPDTEEIVVRPGVFQDPVTQRKYIKTPDGNRKLFVGDLVSDGNYNYVIDEVNASPTGVPRVFLKDVNASPGDLQEFMVGDELNKLTDPVKLPEIVEPDTTPESLGLSEMDYALAMIQMNNYNSAGKPEQGAMGSVDFIELPDGTKMITKKVFGYHWSLVNNIAPDQALTSERDAEVFSDKLAQAIGVEGTGVAHVPGTAGTLAMKIVPGKEAYEYDDALLDLLNVQISSDSAAAPYMEMQNGREIALLDLLTSNPDRHGGNWFIDDTTDSVYPIDGGAGWLSAVEDGQDSPFVDYWFGPVFSGNIKTDTLEINVTRDWTDNGGWTLSELQTVMDKLDAMGPEFTAAGRETWWDRSRAILAALMNGMPK